jgi:hypothetical protein
MRQSNAAAERSCSLLSKRQSFWLVLIRWPENIGTKWQRLRASSSVEKAAWKMQNPLVRHLRPAIGTVQSIFRRLDCRDREKLGLGHATALPENIQHIDCYDYLPVVAKGKRN